MQLPIINKSGTSNVASGISIAAIASLTTNLFTLPGNANEEYATKLATATPINEAIVVQFDHA